MKKRRTRDGPFADPPDTDCRCLWRTLQFLVWRQFRTLAVHASDTLALDLVGQPHSHIHADRTSRVISCSLVFPAIPKPGIRRLLASLLRCHLYEGTPSKSETDISHRVRLPG